MKQQPAVAAGAGGYDLNHWKGRSDGADRYHVAGHVASQPGPFASTFVEDRLYACPYYSPRGGTIDRIACYITIPGTVCNIRLGIYDNVSGYNPYPNNLLSDAGIVVGAGAGLQSYNPALTLQASMLYWLVFNHEYLAAPTFRIQTAVDLFAVAGIDVTWGTLGNHCYSARAFGAHPAVFPAGATFAATAPPTLAVRYSA